MKIEIEIYNGHWIEVTADQLTDDHEISLNDDLDLEIINGSSWYLDGDYTTAPRPIRVTT